MKNVFLKSQSILLIALMLGTGSAFAASDAPEMKKMDDSMSEEMKTMEGEMKEMKESTMDTSHEMEKKMDKDMSEGMQKMDAKEKMKSEMGKAMKN